MRIGVDVDGILTNLQEFMNKAGKDFAKRHNIECKNNVYGYNTLERFGWGKEIDNLFWEETFFLYCNNVKMKENASQIIHKLKEDGHKIYIVTARYYCEENTSLGEKSRECLTNWLKNNDIYYDKIFYTGGKTSKLPIIEDNQIDIFIDDAVKNIDEISKKIPVICLNEPYNKVYENNNMTRCENWEEIYRIIQK